MFLSHVNFIFILYYRLIKIEDSLGEVSQKNFILFNTQPSESLIFIIIMYHLELTPKSYELIIV
jgi:hypothetical protein